MMKFHLVLLTLAAYASGTTAASTRNGSLRGRRLQFAANATEPPNPPAVTFDGGSAVVLTTADLQTGLDAYNRIQGDSRVATQKLVDEINTATGSYSLYRQLAFVAQTIWVSGGYQYRKEVEAAFPPFTTKDNYQDCDFTLEGTQFPQNDLSYYGRGYLQLSWCANYKAYGADRLVLGDPDFFFDHPSVLATTFAMDSAAWYFETHVTDDSGQFGRTTNDLSGAVECVPGYAGDAPQKRFEIFEALAFAVGLTGYSAAGC